MLRIMSKWFDAGRVGALYYKPAVFKRCIPISDHAGFARISAPAA